MQTGAKPSASWGLNEKEFRSVQALPAERRLKYAISRIADREQVWSLKRAEGWVVMADASGRECLPIWPHPDFAKTCAEGTWGDAHPESIELEEWMSNWLPGLKADNRLIAIFPSVVDNAVVLDSDSLQRRLRAELDRIE